MAGDQKSEHFVIMWLPNSGVTRADERAPLLTQTLSTCTMFNINMEERIPPSSIVRRPYCSLLASASLRVLTVHSLLMHESVSTLCANAYYACVFVACARVHCGGAAVKVAARETRGVFAARCGP